MKVAVLRDKDGRVIGVMRGDYTLLPGWVEEDDVGQQPPETPPPPARMKLRDRATGRVYEFEVVP
jgi:hypothetical protein